MIKRIKISFILHTVNRFLELKVSLLTIYAFSFNAVLLLLNVAILNVYTKFFFNGGFIKISYNFVEVFFWNGSLLTIY